MVARGLMLASAVCCTFHLGELPWIYTAPPLDETVQASVPSEPERVADGGAAGAGASASATNTLLSLEDTIE